MRGSSPSAITGLTISVARALGRSTPAVNLCTLKPASSAAVVCVCWNHKEGGRVRRALTSSVDVKSREEEPVVVEIPVNWGALIACNESTEAEDR